MAEKKKILTGQSAETGFVTRMGGREYTGRAGSQATDIILNHPEHGKIDGEMKAGGTIDFSQMRMDVDHSSGQLRQTIGSVQSSGDVTGQYQKRSGKIRDVVRLAQRATRDKQLTPGTQNIERVSRSTGNVKQETRPAAMGEVPTKRLKLNNRNAVDMMHRADPVHIAIHHKTGEVALIPTKDEHAHLGDKMGLKKTVTYDHLGGEDHGHKSTLGVKLRGPRAKGSTFNASVESSSGAMVDAVRDAGGHVFNDIDHATEHLRSHGWGAETGHAMSESVGLLLQGKYEEKVLIEGLATALGSSIMSNILDPDKAKEREETRKKAEAAKTTPAATTDTQTTDTQTTYTEPMTDPFSAPPWPGGKDGAPPPIWGGNQEDNPYKDWKQDDSGKWVKMPASAAPEPTRTETPAPDFSFTPQEKDPSGGLRNRPAERSPHNSSQTGQGKIGMSEGIEKMFSDFLKEKNIELNAVGVLGGPILKDPKKKKVEESAMLMMMPLLYKMQNESRNTINNITHSQGNPDGR